MQLIYYLLNNVRKVGELVLPELLVPSASLAPSFLYSFTFLVSSNFLSIFIVFMFSRVLLSLMSVFLSSFRVSFALCQFYQFVISFFIPLWFFSFCVLFLYSSFLIYFFLTLLYFFIYCLFFLFLSLPLSFDLRVIILTEAVMIP
jgi:hypothetical protein